MKVGSNVVVKSTKELRNNSGVRTGFSGEIVDVKVMDNPFVSKHWSVVYKVKPQDEAHEWINRAYLKELE